MVFLHAKGLLKLHTFFPFFAVLSVIRVNGSDFSKGNGEIEIMVNVKNRFFNIFNVIVPTPTLVGREELYTQMGYVQSILADRYNHRREF